MSVSVECILCTRKIHKDHLSKVRPLSLTMLLLDWQRCCTIVYATQSKPKLLPTNRRPSAIIVMKLS